MVDKIALHPGLIELTVRNDGPDAVAVKQVIVNDGYANFTSKYESVSRLAADTLKVEYPWIEGEAYEIIAPDLDRRHDRRRDPRSPSRPPRRAPTSTG